MCDVIAALSDSTADQSVLFGKNSDRPAGECQVLYYSGDRQAQDQESIQCSYVEIPRTDDVLATVGCRPYWCWGYETGVNERGVIGGNTAIFTRALHVEENQGTPGLTGMDLLRLGLERGHTAEESLDVIVALLEKYGQWGSAVQGHDHVKGGYDNAFLLMDRKEIWILETSGRRWIATRMEQGCRSLSNEPTIRTYAVKESKDLRDYARQSGWWPSGASEFDFAYVYGDHEHYARQVSHIRWKRTSQLLWEKQGSLDVAYMKSILRDHYEDTFLDGPQFHAYLPDFLTVCMHDSPAKFTWGNTATSMVVKLDQDRDIPPSIWVAYGPPCSSAYLNFRFGERLPAELSRSGQPQLTVEKPIDADKDRFHQDSLWWRLYRIIEHVGKKPYELREELQRVLHKFECGIDDDTLQNQVDGLMDVLDGLEQSWGLV